MAVEQHRPYFVNTTKDKIAVSEQRWPTQPSDRCEKVLLVEGVRYRVYPYSAEVWYMLGRMLPGFDAPHPLLARYEWSGPYTPMMHQRRVAVFLAGRRRAYNLSDIGTGKTLGALWPADWMLKEKMIKRILILSPTSTVRSVWASEIFTHFPHWRYDVMQGVGHAAVKKNLAHWRGLHCIIANHELTRAQNRVWFLNERQLQPDLVIIDEGSMFRNPDTDKWRGLRGILAELPYAWVLTGTPTPNSPLDAWGIAAVMGTHNGVRRMAFRDKVEMRVSEYDWVPRKGADQHVKAILSPSIRFSKEDCLDLPPLTYETRTVAMTKAQMDAYKELEHTAVLEAQNGLTATAVNEAVKAQKLLQIACGVLYADSEEVGGDKVEIEIEPTHKLAELKAIAEEVDGPLIVFAPFTSVVKYLHKHFPNSRLFYGDIGVNERAMIVQEFQEGKIKILFANPRTMSHGLTLTRSSCIVWYAPVYSGDTYVQANGRIFRAGQDKPCTVVHLASSEIEEHIYDKLKRRQKVQGTILKALVGASH